MNKPVVLFDRLKCNKNNTKFVNIENLNEPFI